MLVGELAAPSAASARGAGSNPVTALRRLLPEVAGPWGSGHLMTTRLFTVVLTDDGRFAAGAVDPSVLYAALAH